MQIHEYNKKEANSTDIENQLWLPEGRRGGGEGEGEKVHRDRGVRGENY